MHERVLIAASKSAGFTADQDGGAILVQQLARHAPSWFGEVDLLLLREADPDCARPSGVRRLAFLPPDGASGDRFDSRLDGWRPFVDYLNRHGDGYALIVVTHVSNVFGLWQVRASVRAKIVLYPMFTGLSYRLAGELVPDAYLDMERRSLAACAAILTPSETEKLQLVQGYGVDPGRIEVIPRGIDRSLFTPRARSLAAGAPLDIACIGAIRSQKNTLDAVRLVHALALRGVQATMHLAGAVAAPDYAAQCRQLAQALGVGERVRFHGVLPQQELAALVDRCDLAVSVARWETFGRGIFESLTMGVPTLVYRRLRCVWEHLQEGGGIVGTEASPDDMADRIASLARNTAAYGLLSRAAMDATSFLDDVLIMERVGAAWRRAAAAAAPERVQPA